MNTAKPVLNLKEEGIRCVICEGVIDSQLDSFILKEKNSNFWLCPKCSYLLVGKPANTDKEIPLQPNKN